MAAELRGVAWCVCTTDVDLPRIRLILCFVACGPWRMGAWQLAVRELHTARNRFYDLAPDPSARGRYSTLLRYWSQCSQMRWVLAVTVGV